MVTTGVIFSYFVALKSMELYGIPLFNVVQYTVHNGKDMSIMLLFCSL